MKSYINEPNQICTCKYCQKECKIKGFSTHLLKMHKIKFLDYVKENLSEFPNYKICPICNDNLTTGTACSRKCISIWKETAYKGRNIWNEMSEETKQNAKRKISEKASINQIGRNIWAEMSNETKTNAKKMISEKTAARVKGEGNPMYGKKHSAETIQRILKPRPQNKLEKRIADFLDEYGIEYYFQFFITEESTHSYDFKIKGKKLILEIDGDYWHGGPGCTIPFFDVEKTKETDRIKTEIANIRGYELIRFWESEIKADFELVKSKILEEIRNCH